MKIGAAGRGFLLCVLAVAGLGPAAALDLAGPVTQGGLVVGRVEPGARVALDGRALRVAADGRFLLGFGRDHGPKAELKIIAPDGRETVRPLAVAKRRYLIQRIEGLPQALVTPDAATAQRIKDDRDVIAAARGHDDADLRLGQGFVWPAAGPVSGVYGSQRILNGAARAPHVGLDIAGPEGAPVVATADGVVALARDDMVLTGKTVIIDHGHGLTTSYVHLSEVSVSAGAHVRQGAPIGRIGKTGRVTGAHLHWGVHLFDVALDPALLVPGSPDPARNP